ncbi:MAG: putative rRNA maturation factor [Paracoccaceae bacterium]|jgi:probable rRNA maturation factor
MTMDLTLEDPRWASLTLDTLAVRATAAALTHLSLDPDLCEFTLLACDDARITDLNKAFRDKPTATNVLSWPTTDLAADQLGGQPHRPEPDFTGEIALGDIAIAWETCTQEAETGGIALHDHVTHLIVHGLLHLLGYDHIRDPDATLMEQLEGEILGKLGISDPYTKEDGPYRPLSDR